MTNIDTTLQELAAPSGSDFYYCCLFYGKDRKHLLFNLHALNNELTEIIYRCSDPGVARLKLHWWHEEIERIHNHSARHPLGKSLQSLPDTVQLNTHLFHQLVAHQEHILDGVQVNTREELLEFYKAGPGLLWATVADIFNYNEQTTITYAEETGSLLAYYKTLFNTRITISNGYRILPAGLLQKAGINYTDLSGPDTKKSRKFFADQFLWIIEKLDFYFNNFPSSDKKQHIHISILNRLAKAHCNAVIKDDCNILSNQTKLTPLYKLWIAWRTHLQS